MRTSVLCTLGIITLSILCFSGALQAQISAAPFLPRLALSPDLGPPTTKLSVTGKEFAAGDTVEIFFDSIQLARVTAGRQGEFQVVVTVPATALPGAHKVEARGLRAGGIASCPFLVRTDWLQFHFDAARTGVNSFENVLNPNNVPYLSIDSRTPIGGVIESSAAYCGGSIFIGSNDGNIYRQPPL